jgi:hypothetical protein
MSTLTSFEIFNDSGLDMEIVHEPHSFTFELPPNEAVLVESNAGREDIQLKVAIENGKISISIWANGLYRVLKDGADVFEKYL